MFIPDKHDESLASERRHSPHRLDPCLFSIIYLHEVEGLIVLGQTKTWQLPFFSDHQHTFTGPLEETSHLHHGLIGRIDLRVLEPLDTVSDRQHRLASANRVDVLLNHFHRSRITLRNTENVLTQDVIHCGLLRLPVRESNRRGILEALGSIGLLDRSTPDQKCHQQHETGE
ncbi:MAG: hypothetical protein DSY81_05070 [Bacillota bacterium]|nr:MAG: hypothetical protein DSY92_02995 [Planctomycetota bacterium]RUA09728.1 MAG: hypothetical protein DSY81_05070 [Bacillota bacterium]